MTNNPSIEDRWRGLDILTCSKCSLKTSDPALLQVHHCKQKFPSNMASVSFNSSTEMFACSLCKIEMQELEFTRHLETHLSIKPYVCKYCSFDAATIGDIFHHLYTVHRQCEPTFLMKLSSKTKEIIHRAKKLGSCSYKVNNPVVLCTSNINEKITGPNISNLNNVELQAKVTNQLLLQLPSSSVPITSTNILLKSQVTQATQLAADKLPHLTNVQNNSLNQCSTSSPNCYTKQRVIVIVPPKSTLAQNGSLVTATHSSQAQVSVQLPPVPELIPDVSNRLSSPARHENQTFISNKCPQIYPDMQDDSNETTLTSSLAIVNSVSNINSLPILPKANNIDEHSRDNTSISSGLLNTENLIIDKSNDDRVNLELPVRKESQDFTSNLVANAHVTLVLQNNNNSSTLSDQPCSLNAVIKEDVSSNVESDWSTQIGIENVVSLSSVQSNQQQNINSNCSQRTELLNSRHVTADCTLSTALACTKQDTADCSQSTTLAYARQGTADCSQSTALANARHAAADYSQINEFSNSMHVTADSSQSTALACAKNDTADCSQSIALAYARQGTADCSQSTALAFARQDTAECSQSTALAYARQGTADCSQSTALAIARQDTADCSQNTALAYAQQDTANRSQSYALTHARQNIAVCFQSTELVKTLHETAEQQTKTAQFNDFTSLRVVKGYFLCLKCKMKWCHGYDLFFKHIWHNHVHGTDFSCCPMGFNTGCVRLQNAIRSIYAHSQEPMSNQIRDYLMTHSTYHSHAVNTDTNVTTQLYNNSSLASTVPVSVSSSSRMQSKQNEKTNVLTSRAISNASDMLTQIFPLDTSCSFEKSICSASSVIDSSVLSNRQETHHDHFLGNLTSESPQEPFEHTVSRQAPLNAFSSNAGAIEIVRSQPVAQQNDTLRRVDDAFITRSSACQESNTQASMYEDISNDGFDNGSRVNQAHITSSYNNDVEELPLDLSKKAPHSTVSIMPIAPTANGVDTITNMTSMPSENINTVDESALKLFFQCAFSSCSFISSNSFDFEVHYQQKHTTENEFPCFYCGFRNASSKHLLKHLEDHLTTDKEKTFSCSLLENSDKVAHFENNDIQFILRMLNTSFTASSDSGACLRCLCNICQSEFVNLGELDKHLRTSLLKVIACKYCKNYFLNSHSWQMHMTTEHIDLPRVYNIIEKLLCNDMKISAYVYDWSSQNLSGFENAIVEPAPMGAEEREILTFQRPVVSQSTQSFFHNNTIGNTTIISNRLELQIAEDQSLQAPKVIIEDEERAVDLILPVSHQMLEVNNEQVTSNQQTVHLMDSMSEESANATCMDTLTCERNKANYLKRSLSAAIKTAGVNKDYICAPPQTVSERENTNHQRHTVAQTVSILNRSEKSIGHESQISTAVTNLSAGSISYNDNVNNCQFESGVNTSGFDHIVTLGSRNADELIIVKSCPDEHLTTDNMNFTNEMHPQPISNLNNINHQENNSLLSSVSNNTIASLVERSEQSAVTEIQNVSMSEDKRISLTGDLISNAHDIVGSQQKLTKEKQNQSYLTSSADQNTTSAYCLLSSDNQSFPVSVEWGTENSSLHVSNSEATCLKEVPNNEHLSASKDDCLLKNNLAPQNNDCHPPEILQKSTTVAGVHSFGNSNETGSPCSTLCQNQITTNIPLVSEEGEVSSVNNLIDEISSKNSESLITTEELKGNKLKEISTKVTDNMEFSLSNKNEITVNNAQQNIIASKSNDLSKNTTFVNVEEQAHCSDFIFANDNSLQTENFAEEIISISSGNNFNQELSSNEESNSNTSDCIIKVVSDNTLYPTKLLSSQKKKVFQDTDVLQYLSTNQTNDSTLNRVNVKPKMPKEIIQKTSKESKFRKKTPAKNSNHSTKHRLIDECGSIAMDQCLKSLYTAKNDKFSCTKCRQIFFSLKKIHSHIFYCHGKIGVVHCCYCLLQGEHDKAIRIHMQNDHLDRAANAAVMHRYFKTSELMEILQMHSINSDKFKDICAKLPLPKHTENNNNIQVSEKATNLVDESTSNSPDIEFELNSSSATVLLVDNSINPNHCTTLSIISGNVEQSKTQESDAVLQSDKSIISAQNVLKPTSLRGGEGNIIFDSGKDEENRSPRKKNKKRISHDKLVPCPESRKSSGDIKAINSCSPVQNKPEITSNEHRVTNEVTSKIIIPTKSCRSEVGIHVDKISKHKTVKSNIVTKSYTNDSLVMKKLEDGQKDKINATEMNKIDNANTKTPVIKQPSSTDLTSKTSNTCMPNKDVTLNCKDTTVVDKSKTHSTLLNKGYDTKIPNTGEQAKRKLSQHETIVNAKSTVVNNGTSKTNSTKPDKLVKISHAGTQEDKQSDITNKALSISNAIKPVELNKTNVDTEKLKVNKIQMKDNLLTDFRTSDLSMESKSVKAGRSETKSRKDSPIQSIKQKMKVIETNRFSKGTNCDVVAKTKNSAQKMHISDKKLNDINLNNTQDNKQSQEFCKEENSICKNTIANTTIKSITNDTAVPKLLQIEQESITMGKSLKPSSDDSAVDTISRKTVDKSAISYKLVKRKEEERLDEILNKQDNNTSDLQSSNKTESLPHKHHRCVNNLQSKDRTAKTLLQDKPTKEQSIKSSIETFEKSDECSNDTSDKTRAATLNSLKSVSCDTASKKRKLILYQCVHKNCDFKCEWNAEIMKEHINKNHPYYSCGYCKVSYTLLHFLKNHQKFIHRGRKPNIVYGGTMSLDLVFVEIDNCKASEVESHFLGPSSAKKLKKYNQNVSNQPHVLQNKKRAKLSCIDAEEKSRVPDINSNNPNEKTSKQYVDQSVKANNVKFDTEKSCRKECEQLIPTAYNPFVKLYKLKLPIVENMSLKKATPNDNAAYQSTVTSEHVNADESEKLVQDKILQNTLHSSISCKNDKKKNTSKSDIYLHKFNKSPKFKSVSKVNFSGQFCKGITTPSNIKKQCTSSEQTYKATNVNSSISVSKGHDKQSDVMIMNDTKIATPRSSEKSGNNCGTWTVSQLETKTAAEGSYEPENMRTSSKENKTAQHQFKESNPASSCMKNTSSMKAASGESSHNYKKEVCKIKYPFRCTVCRKIVKCLNDIKEHFQERHPKKDVQLTERISGFVYSSSGQCIVGRDRKKAPTLPYLCRYCNFRSSKRCHVEDHHKSDHPQKDLQVFTLNSPQVVMSNNNSTKLLSDSTFDDQASGYNSSVIKYYHCSICDNTERSEFLFRLHLVKHACFNYMSFVSNDALFVCSTCRYVAKTNNELARHIDNHMLRHKFTCILSSYDNEKKIGIKIKIRNVHNTNLNNDDIEIIDKQRQTNFKLIPRLVNINPVVLIQSLK